MGLQQFEQRLERLVEGAFAKAFRGELQPIELGRRLTREMDLHRTVSVRGFIAPNAFSVLLSKEDFERFGSFVDVLADELSGAAREHARSEGYKFLGPVEIHINSDDRLQKSTYSIASDVVEAPGGSAASIILPNGKRIPIGTDPLTIGRMPECDIPVADPNVSRRHAEIRREGDAVYVADLNSTNGTRVNGAPITQHVLSDGEIITIGLTSMRFESL